MRHGTRLLFVLGLALPGCADALPEITDIERPRVLAADVVVVGDEERSAPFPGETIRVELVVADDGPRAARAFAMIVCEPGESTEDLGVCARVLPGGVIRSDTLDPSVVPSFTFAVPADLGDVDHLLVYGAVCADGPLAPDLVLPPSERMADDDPCLEPGDVGELVLVRIPLADEAPNTRPAFAGITLDGAPWELDAPLDAAATGCAGGELAEVLDDALEHTIGLAITSASRELFFAEDGSTEEEAPFVAFHATDGDFDGAYAIFAGEDARNATWRARDDRAPSTVPPEGRLVRFVFVLRDGRGGTRVLRRALCVLASNG